MLLPHINPVVGGITEPPMTDLWAWYHAEEAYTETSGTPTTLQTTDNADVGSLKDLSGNGYHVYQTVAGEKPHYLTNQQNGLPGIDFDGSNDHLDGATSSFPSGDNTLSIFIVAEWDATANLKAIFGAANSARPSMVIGFGTSLPNNNVVGFYANNNGDPISGSATIGDQTGTTYLIAASRTGTTAKGAIDAQTTQSITVGGGTGGSILSLGHYNNNSKYNGRIFEVLFYDAYISDFDSGDGLLARQYLDQRWGLGLGL